MLKVCFDFRILLLQGIVLHNRKATHYLYKSYRLFVPKDLANPRTDMFLFYNVTSDRFWEGLILFWGRVPPSSQEKSPLEEIDYEQNLMHTNAGASRQEM